MRKDIYKDGISTRFPQKFQERARLSIRLEKSMLDTLDSLPGDNRGEKVREAIALYIKMRSNERDRENIFTE